MAELHLEGLPGNNILDPFEINNNEISYSIDTITYIKQKYPYQKIYLIIGEDNLENFHMWKDYKIILEQIDTLLVYKRSPELKKVNNIESSKIKILDNKLVNISSSEIRENSLQQIPVKILNYIKTNNLYEKII